MFLDLWKYINAKGNKMSLKIKAIFTIITISLLSGCSSNNIRAYRPAPSIKYDLPHSNQKIYVKSVTMPEGDTNSIMCRAAGNIYLPQKMTYSAYIGDALRKNLTVIDKLSDSSYGAHTIDVVLTQVTFNSLAGEWFIDGDIKIDNQKPLTINTISQYGTSYFAIEACRNTAESFDEAVTNFIKKILNHPDIVQNLR
jgi:hypothetical protein